MKQSNFSILRQCTNVFLNGAVIFRAAPRFSGPGHMINEWLWKPWFSVSLKWFYSLHTVASNDKRSGICAVYVISNRLWNERTYVRFAMALSYCLPRSISISLFGKFLGALHTTGPMFVSKYWRRGLARTKAASIYFGPNSCRLDRKGIVE